MTSHKPISHTATLSGGFTHKHMNLSKVAHSPPATLSPMRLRTSVCTRLHGKLIALVLRPQDWTETEFGIGGQLTLHEDDQHRAAMPEFKRYSWGESME